MTSRASRWERPNAARYCRAASPAGDVIYGLRSSGVHSNGFSLVRRIVSLSGLDWEAPCPFAAGQSLAEALLVPTRIYVKLLLAALKRTDAIRALAHITGGGFIDNLPRVLPPGLGCVLDLDAVEVLPVFRWLACPGWNRGLRDGQDLQLRDRHGCGGGT